MSKFLHTLAEELRAREKFLEDHNDHPVFVTEDGETLRQEFEALLARIQDFGHVVDGALKRGDDIDLDFRDSIADHGRKLEVEIHAWRKKFDVT